MDLDFVLNGLGFGSVGQNLAKVNGDVNVLRPFIGSDGRNYINVADASSPTGAKAIVTNAGATLRKDEWQQIDDMVVKAARPRMKIVNSLRSAGLTTSIPNAFGTTVYQYERQSDISAARVSMDALAAGDNDRPVYDLVNLPLPIISKEVSMNARQIAASRNGNTPLDLSMLELAAIKVAETAESLVLGTYGTYAFGGGTLYGYLNFPSRITGTFADPAGGGWTPTALYNSVIEMLVAATNKYHYGPFKLWYSTGLMQYMMQQFSLYDSTALQNRISQLPNISSVEMADYLTGKQLLLVQQTSDVSRLIVGMDITTVQWPEKGGLEEKFRVMAMFVPQMKVDQAGNTGIVHYVSA